uniref:CCHC-type domain-containing protein n=1 Tax=Beta vulgaris subsp. vulgaris TaxID=3555 RepID=F4NCJ3_BETVV|nr:hypothetical protein [Beta vulgaris subsp. vulgaris]
MADEIILKVSAMKLTAEEDKTLAFDDISDTANNQDFTLSLIGKVVTVRSFNFDALKRTLNQIWSISKGAIFRIIENDLFVVQFACKRDKEKVMAGRPWSFDQSLVLLQEIDADVQPSNVRLTHSPFWVRVYNLPMRCRSEQHIRMIGGCIGDVLEVDTHEILWDKSARIRVLIDITKPLRRVQRFALKNGVSALVEIKYERLPTFCFLCGVIGHIGRDCVEVFEEDKEGESQWGAWLRASPRRGRQKMEEEEKCFLKGARALEFVRIEKEPTSRNMHNDLRNVEHDCPPTKPMEAHVSGAMESIAGAKLAAAEFEEPHAVAVHAAVPEPIGGVGLVSIPSIMVSSLDVDKSFSGDFNNQNNNMFSFVAGEGKVATKFKKLKQKSRLTKVAGEAFIDINNVSPCHIESGGKAGDKRKMVDNMIVDDINDSDNLSSKKHKLNDFSENDNNVDIVEAEVGCNQPRQAL